MKLITYYIAITLVADAVAVFLCLAIERFWPAASMPIFIGLYFAILWGGWAAAVRLTEEEDVTVAAAPPSSQPAE